MNPQKENYKTSLLSSMYHSHVIEDTVHCYTDITCGSSQKKVSRHFQLSSDKWCTGTCKEC